MAFIAYPPTPPITPWKQAMIDQVNEIVTDYKQQGYSLSLRQVYYQFVSRDLLPQKWADKATGSTNNERSYKNLGQLISDGRMAGLIDWAAIEDRTRNLSGNSHWSTPAGVIESAAYSYKNDLWSNQDYYVEVWVEKDALEGVVSRPCRRLDVNFFSCRGYTSQTAMHDAGLRLKKKAEAGKNVLVLHLGDHDPSGIDMSRDIEDRLRLFMGEEEPMLEVRRIALTMKQIRQYAPPPNPAKITDSRAHGENGYINVYGPESWELDALEPTVLDALITKHVLSVRDEEQHAVALARQTKGQEALKMAARRWPEVADYLENGYDTSVYPPEGLKKGLDSYKQTASPEDYEATLHEIDREVWKRIDGLDNEDGPDNDDEGDWFDSTKPEGDR